MNPDAERWLKQAEYDAGTAEDLYRVSRWAACVLHAQQSAEKALKALIVERTNSMPPRRHDIRGLADSVGLLDKLPADALRLSDYYIGVRYPDASDMLPYESMDESVAHRCLDAARAVLKLVDSELGSKP